MNGKHRYIHFYVMILIHIEWIFMVLQNGEYILLRIKKNILKDSSIPGVDLSGRDKLYASLILNITEEINSIPYMESNKGCIKNCPGKIL